MLTVYPPALEAFIVTVTGVFFLAMPLSNGDTGEVM